MTSIQSSYEISLTTNVITQGLHVTNWIGGGALEVPATSVWEPSICVPTSVASVVAVVLV